MGTIAELRTRPDRLREDQADLLRQAILPLEDQMPDAVRALIGHVDRHTASRRRWTFVMLSPEQNDLVVTYLVEHSSRPLVAVRLWSLCFRHLRLDTGEITLRRDEIADALGQRVQEISVMMGELEDFGAIIRKREHGRVRYWMNPRVATHLAGRERDEAQAAAPLLTLMEGGKASV